MIPQFTDVRADLWVRKNTLMKNITITRLSEGDLNQTRADGSTKIIELQVRKYLKRIRKSL